MDNRKWMAQSEIRNLGKQVLTDSLVLVLFLFYVQKEAIELFKIGQKTIQFSLLKDHLVFGGWIREE